MSWNTRNGAASGGGATRPYANEAWAGAITLTTYPVSFSMYASAVGGRAVLTITDTGTGLVVATVTPMSNWAYGTNTVSITSGTPGVDWITPPTNHHTYSFSLYSAPDGYITPTPWPQATSNFPVIPIDIILTWGQSNMDVAPTWGSYGAPDGLVAAANVYQYDYTGTLLLMTGATANAINVNTNLPVSGPMAQVAYRINDSAATTSTGYIVDGRNPALPFANAYATRTGHNVCVVAMALGSTGFTPNGIGTDSGSPFEQWSSWLSTYSGGLASDAINGCAPTQSDDVNWITDGNMYNAGLARAANAFTALLDAGFTPNFKTMIAVHGEQDSYNGLDAASYALALQTLILAMRSDLAAVDASGATMSVILGGWGDPTMYTATPNMYGSTYAYNAQIDSARQWLATGTTGAAAVSATNGAITNPTYAGAQVSLGTSTMTPNATNGTTTSFVFTLSSTAGFAVGQAVTIRNVITASRTLNGVLGVITGLVTNTSITVTYAIAPATDVGAAVLTLANITPSFEGMMPLAGFGALPFVTYAPTTTAAGYSYAAYPGLSTTGTTPHFSVYGMNTLGQHFDYALQAGFANTGLPPGVGLFSGLGAGVPPPLSAWNFAAADRDLAQMYINAPASFWTPTTYQLNSPPVYYRPGPIPRARAAALPGGNARLGRGMRNLGGELGWNPTTVSPANTSGGGSVYTFYGVWPGGYQTGDWVYVNNIVGGSLGLNGNAQVTGSSFGAWLELTYPVPPTPDSTNADLSSGPALITSSVFGTLAFPLMVPGPGPALNSESFTQMTATYRTYNPAMGNGFLTNFYNCYPENIATPNGGGPSLSGGGTYTNDQNNTPYTASPWYSGTATYFVDYDRTDFRGGTLQTTNTNTPEIWTLAVSASAGVVSDVWFQIAYAGDGGSPYLSIDDTNPNLPLDPCPLVVGAIEIGGTVQDGAFVPGFTGTWSEYYVWDVALTPTQYAAVTTWLRVVTTAFS
jgi:hypothetical protein